MCTPTYTKILVIRLSSIGDIILTTPVIRSLKKARPDTQLHYLIKEQYAPTLQNNPYIDHMHYFRGSITDTIQELKAENFDLVIDLHKNLRSFLIKALLMTPSVSFDKKNIAKWKMTTFKTHKHLPHIVKRYAQTLEKVNVSLDEEGLDFYIPREIIAEAEEIISTKLPKLPQAYAIALGATFATKKWPADYYIKFINAFGQPVILLGGQRETAAADMITKELKVDYINCTGKASLMLSSAMVAKSSFIITHDTGLMHIAAALKKRMITIWGNTVPGFGMTPYKCTHLVLENKNLSCRPCSKLGHTICPKKHFDCMMEITPSLLLENVRRFMS